MLFVPEGPRKSGGDGAARHMHMFMLRLCDGI